jgi:tRNA modification GTPase
MWAEGQHFFQDSIAAIATASGRGAVGIVRISGPVTQQLMRDWFGEELTPRHATYLPFKDGQGQVLDQGLALYFAAPRSYTGEDVLELQAHGGPIVLQLLLARCLELGQAHGLRLAVPGEFTQRAFLNDKLDLAQAEAVADLIDASTEAAARSASRSLAGKFSQEIEKLRHGMVNLRMLVEAAMDFPEEDIDFLQEADAYGKLQALISQLSQVFNQSQQGALLRDGMTVVLAGQPNVGKSSLLNVLAGAELAIVTPIAGTTRDKVKETIQIEGVPLHLIDTAGLRDADDDVERIGVDRSWEAIAQADAVVFLHDLTRGTDTDYAEAEEKIAFRMAQAGVDNEKILHLYTKKDALETEALARHSQKTNVGSLTISAKTEEGLCEFRQRLLGLAGWRAHDQGGEGLFIARTRHLEALKKAQMCLSKAKEHLVAGVSMLDLFAEEMRLAHQALGEITGAFSADDLLGEIFSRFCIGK